MGIGAYSAPSKRVKTDLGVPDQPEQPAVCGASIDSLTVYFFTENPEQYGGCAQLFENRFSGCGASFEESAIEQFTLDEAVRLGKDVALSIYFAPPTVVALLFPPPR